MDLIVQARELGKMLQQDQRYIDYHQAKVMADNDVELTRRIEVFNRKKEELQQETRKPEQDKAKVSRLDHEVRELYGEIMKWPTMVAFDTAKTEMDSLIQLIQQIVVHSANGDDPESVTEHNCSPSGCSGCSGCG